MVVGGEVMAVQTWHAGWSSAWGYQLFDRSTGPVHGVGAVEDDVAGCDESSMTGRHSLLFLFFEI